MDDIYYRVDINGNVQKIDTFTNGIDVDEFLVKEHISISYSYGDHAKYELIGVNGLLSNHQFGDYSLISYETTGVSYDYRLRITFSIKQDILSYELHTDARFRECQVPHPIIDAEWDINNPTSSAVLFMKDLAKIGYDARKQIDELKRSLFLTKRELSIIAGKSEKMRQICQGATKVIIPEGTLFIDGDVFEECYLVQQIVLPKSVLMMVPSVFNNVHTLNSVYLLGDRVITLINPAFSFGYSGDNTMSTNVTFYVKPSLLDAYKNSIWWRAVADNIYPLDDEWKV